MEASLSYIKLSVKKPKAKILETRSRVYSVSWWNNCLHAPWPLYYIKLQSWHSGIGRKSLLWSKQTFYLKLHSHPRQFIAIYLSLKGGFILQPRLASQSQKSPYPEFWDYRQSPIYLSDSGLTAQASVSMVLESYWTTITQSLESIDSNIISSKDV